MIWRNHPYLVYFPNLYWLGFKYPFDRLEGENENREEIMRDFHHGLTYPDPGPEGLDDAWARIEKDGRFFHDGGNLVVTHTCHPDMRSYNVKFLCSIIAYGTVVFLLMLGILVWSLIPAPF